jgi:hypothetical protein
VLNAGSFGVQKDASVEVAFYQTRSDMTVPRDLHTATLLNDGRVLITGGTTGIQVFVGPRLASSELYDPVSSVFTASGSMSTTREFHTATILPNGKVLIAGGGGPGPSEELYDPATGGFSVTGTMISARAQHTATLLPSGQVLITGGDTTIAATTAELYDPTTGVFSSTGSMSVPRNGHTATLLNDGRVLIAGGEGTTVAETYDPATGTFSNAGNLTTERSYHQATLLNGGKVLLTGGHRNNPQPSASLASAELYDPVNGTFTATSPMSSPREFHTAAALLNGQVLIAGGADGTTFSFLASIEKFDPATGTLPTTGSMSADHTLGVRIAHTATLLQDGRVLLAGGASGSGTIASAELYQPSMRFPAGLSNTKVIPANASISLGSTQRFLQLLGFLDGSTQVAAVATWTSSNPAIAPINWLGMAVGSAVGTAFITATLGFFFFGAGATLQVK